MCRPLAVTVGLWCQGERWAGPHASICYSRRARGGGGGPQRCANQAKPIRGRRPQRSSRTWRTFHHSAPTQPCVETRVAAASRLPLSASVRSRTAFTRQALGGALLTCRLLPSITTSPIDTVAMPTLGKSGKLVSAAPTAGLRY